ncbi:MAG: GNAT family N-acetyltransferase [Lachnospiraceae bacterium]|nr:GNAT family N-acetyltransferase [Lachnospiraceae bacterium]
MVRFAKQEDLERVNELRKMVNDLHVGGKPEVFKPGFNEELKNYIYEIREDPNKDIVVAELDGVVCGYAVVAYISRPENPFMNERRFVDIDEFGVDAAFRRRGAATEMVEFVKKLTKEKGYDRLELNMWEFNREALAFYEAVGFETYRRYMEIKL